MKFIVHYVSHTHYDAEVFLTRDETFELGYSILAGALSAMRQNPGFKFAIDQTCYIEPFLKAYPELRNEFEQRITTGQLEVTCGMLAMPDVNIPSGESFIRQVQAGKRWCKTELGVDIKTGWLLDTFGQHPQIPQLMAKCGFDRNLFQRLGDTDSPTEYWWKGIDGTELFCHWMRASYAVLYGAPKTLPEFHKFVHTRLDQLKKHAQTPHILAVSGADLTPAEPHVAALFEEYNRTYDDFEFRISTPQEYFDALNTCQDVVFPVCEGDRNPVFQGCYSARIAVKQWNRKMETVLGQAEMLGTLAHSVAGNASHEDAISRIWEPVLFNQFHDIICGSHVDKVYRNVIDRYVGAHQQASALRAESLAEIANLVSTEECAERTPIIVFNPLSWDRDDAVEADVAFVETDIHELDVRDSAGSLVLFDLLSCERYGTGGIKRAKVLFIASHVPALGYEVYSIGRADAQLARPQSSLTSNQPDFLMLNNHTDAIENEFLAIEIDAWNGAIKSLYDKATDFEFIPMERQYGGTIVRELDNGNFWEYNGHCKGDALHPMNREHRLPAEGDSRAAFSHHYGGDGRITNGRARIDYNVNFAFGKGWYSTRIRVYSGLPRIDIQTRLINEDERVRYRMALPTALHNGQITHEIPFGAIERPEGEFAVQNWADYGDAARGLAVLNRGLPGCSVHDNVILLSLLKCTALKEGYGEVGGFNRSTKTTDGYEIGVQHTFDYALYPHIGDWRDANLVRRGLEFNQPLIATKQSTHPGKLPARLSFCSISASNVVVSAMKSSGDSLIVRLYESFGWQTEDVELRLAFAVQEAWETDLLENKTAEVEIAGGGPTRFKIGPFEIKTFAFKTAGLNSGSAS